MTRVPVSVVASGVVSQPPLVSMAANPANAAYLSSQQQAVLKQQQQQMLLEQQKQREQKLLLEQQKQYLMGQQRQQQQLLAEQVLFMYFNIVKNSSWFIADFRTALQFRKSFQSSPIKELSCRTFWS